MPPSIFASLQICAFVRTCRWKRTGQACIWGADTSWQVTVMLIFTHHHRDFAAMISCLCTCLLRLGGADGVRRQQPRQHRGHGYRGLHGQHRGRCMWCRGQQIVTRGAVKQVQGGGPGAAAAANCDGDAHQQHPRTGLDAPHCCCY